MHIIRKITISLAALLILNIISVFIYWNISASYSKYSFNNSFACGIVFFHSVTKQGNLSNETNERCNLALRLFKDGMIKNILCAGGASSNKAGSNMMKDYLIDFGIPDSIIITDSLSYSSKTNISEAYKHLNIKNYKSALLISSPTHILRLKYLANREMSGIRLSEVTFNINYSLVDIYLDCNTEFIKWVYLLFLPDEFAQFSKRFL